MKRDEALQKIKKCLALAASPEAHEAAAAMRQAQKLMQQFGFSAEDVSLTDVEEKGARARNASLQQWEVMMVALVAQAFGCQYFTSQRRIFGRTERTFVFVGVSPAAEVATYAYEVLARQCAKDRKAHMAKQPKNCKPATKTARGDAYAMGWVAGVKGKLPAPEINEHSQQLVQRYQEINHAELGTATVKDRTKGSNVSHRDWIDGMEDGRRADYHQGLHGRSRQAQLTA